jgi:protein-S-isoprenylcysteine O-methyltransferase Ste14
MRSELALETTSRGALHHLLATAWNAGTTALVCILFAAFAYSHLVHWVDSGRPTGLVLAIQESILVVLFLIRRRPSDVSTNGVDWLAAFAGTFVVLLLRPTGHAVLGMDWLFTGLQLAGSILAIWGALYLGRSFGIVAANRGVQANGPYRFVRHPIYAAYLLSLTGYLLASPSPSNLLVVTLHVVAQVQRVRAEETVLMRDPGYCAYAQRTAHRLVPGLV